MLPATHFNEKFDPFDLSQPRSMVNLLPKEIKQKVLELPEELLRLTDRKLWHKVKPNDATELLRFSFWREYSDVQDNVLQGMRIGNIVFGICSRQYFYKEILENEKAMLWIVKPPLQYNIILEQLLYQGLQRLKEVLDLPIIQDGKVNNGTIMRITQVFEKLDARRNGPLNRRTIVKKDALELAEDLTEKELEKIGNFDGDIHDLLDKLGELDGTVDRSEKASPSSEEEATRS